MLVTPRQLRSRAVFRELPESVQAFASVALLQRRPIALAVAEAAKALPPGARVLDAGAGDAPYRPLFAHCDYQTQDWPNSPHALAGTADVVADLHDLPDDLDGFDLVVCTEVLEHVEDPAVVARQLHKILLPGGELLVTVPFVGALHEEPYDFTRFTNAGLRSVLERAGFRVESVAPLTGFWSTLALLLRFAGLATMHPDERPPPAPRLLAAIAFVVSLPLTKIAPAMDRLDPRRALPIGWVARAVRPAGSE